MDISVLPAAGKPMNEWTSSVHDHHSADNAHTSATFPLISGSGKPPLPLPLTPSAPHRSTTKPFVFPPLFVRQEGDGSFSTVAFLCPPGEDGVNNQRFTTSEVGDVSIHHCGSHLTFTVQNTLSIHLGSLVNQYPPHRKRKTGGNAPRAKLDENLGRCSSLEHW